MASGRAALLQKLQNIPEEPASAHGNKDEEELENARREGAVEALKKISALKHAQEFEESELGKAHNVERGPPKKRGRPRKNPQEESFKFNAPASAPSVIQGEDGDEWTELGRATKRKVEAMMTRLGDRLNGFSVQVSRDTDAAWLEAMSDVQSRLGDAAAEASVKSIFFTALNVYEQSAQRGYLNPMGWDTSNLTALAQKNQAFFDPELVELSILYSEFFAHGPLLRLLGNTFSFIQQVDKANVTKFQESMAADASEKAGKYSAL